MSALGNYIERAGVATVSISLIREQSEAVGPPRALWVPYALGRPLGSAEDPDFQKDVMRAAFGLLGTTTEPTIADYEVAAPDEVEAGEWACPLNLAPDEPDESLIGRLSAEVARLRPWALETRSARGRTLFGASGAGSGQIDEVVAALGHLADSGDLVALPPGDVDWAHEMPLLIRHLVDDVRTVYHEAIAAQPGSSAPNHDALNEWIFGGTALGDCLIAIGDHLGDDDRPMAQVVRGLTIPEGRYRGGSAFPATSEFGAN
ncbi:MAG: hypothetical protein P8N02_13280 [Actinomycetota bacterium]|nr:hypothetical protein [Actinomycetota bacterium]